MGVPAAHAICQAMAGRSHRSISVNVSRRRAARIRYSARMTAPIATTTSTLRLSPGESRRTVYCSIGVSSAQAIDFRAGSLKSSNTTGGPEALAHQPFFIGINDPLGNNPSGVPFTSTVFTLFDSWANTHGSDDGQNRRASIARGQTLFNA